MATGTYFVTVTDEKGCSKTGQVTIADVGYVNAELLITQISCYGLSNGSVSVNPIAGTPPFSYLWSDGQSGQTAQQLAEGDYSLTISDNNNCSFSIDFSIFMPPQLELTLAVNNASCENTNNGSAQANINGGTPPYTYQWSNGSTSASPANLPVGNYSLSISDANSCTIDTSIVVTFSNPAPEVNFYPENPEGCYPHCTRFIPESSQQIATCYWSFGDGTFSSDCSPQHCYHAAGNYPVTLSVFDINGCSGFKTINPAITVYQTPRADFTFEPRIPDLNNAKVNFFDQSIGANQWEWVFNCCGTDTVYAQNPVVNFTDTGTYSVLLIVVSEQGCIDSVRKSITVRPDITFYVPNAFTPSDTEWNNGWRGFGTFIDDATYEMYVFNRWGEVVYQSNDLYEEWDGRSPKGGSRCPSGVYTYVVSFKSSAGKEYKFIGKVTLIR